ncbi:hypothetical protein ACT6QG_10645 [Xanthobacter sp. TB0136]
MAATARLALNTFLTRLLLQMTGLDENGRNHPEAHPDFDRLWTLGLN